MWVGRATALVLLLIALISPQQVRAGLVGEACPPVAVEAQLAPVALLAGPAPVQIGAYVNDIQTVDLAHHRFSADFYLWFRWRDPQLNPICTFEFMNIIEPDQFTLSPIYDVAQKQPDGWLYQAARVQGVFSSKFALASYPFDRQTLTIDIEDSASGADKLAFQNDTISTNRDIVLPGYRIGTATLEARPKAYPTTFGDRNVTAGESYSRVSLNIPIDRPGISGAVKKFLPVALVILCASAALLLAARHLDAQIGLTITALLTLVAQQFAMAGELPEVSYLLMIDQIYIASYAYILLLIAIVVVRSRFADEDGIMQVKTLRRLDGARVLCVALLTYVIGIAAIVYFSTRT